MFQMSSLVWLEEVACIPGILALHNMNKSCHSVRVKKKSHNQIRWGTVSEAKLNRFLYFRTSPSLECADADVPLEYPRVGQSGQCCPSFHPETLKQRSIPRLPTLLGIHFGICIDIQTG